jgi:hypothetical protein
VHWIGPVDDAWYAVAIGLTIAVLGLGLWRSLDRPLQLLTGAGGVLVTCGGVIGLTGMSTWIAAPVLQVASIAFAGLTLAGRVRPRLVALVISAVGLMIGAFLYADLSQEFSAIMAMVSAAGIVTFALVDRSWPLVALGLLAFFVATTSMMETVLDGIVARLIAVVLGLTVLAAVAFRAQKMQSRN